MIAFFSLFELFPAFICANNTGSLTGVSLFGVSILILFPYFISSFVSNVGTCGISTDILSSSSTSPSESRLSYLCVLRLKLLDLFLGYDFLPFFLLCLSVLK